MQVMNIGLLKIKFQKIGAYLFCLKTDKYVLNRIPKELSMEERKMISWSSS
jgi:hypothetical protein